MRKQKRVKNTTKVKPKRDWKPSSKDNSMKKTKEAKRWENKKRTWNEDMWKRQVYDQNQLMSKPTKKSVLFRIKMERVSVFFSFFFFLPFVTYLFFLFSVFCYLFFCILFIIYRENQCLSLPLYISSNKHGFS